MRRKLGALADALVGRFSDHHAFYCRQVLDHLDFINKMITDLGGRIDAETAAYEPQIALLDTVPGIDRRGAQTILAEIGPEMHRFASLGSAAPRRYSRRPPKPARPSAITTVASAGT